MNDTSSETTSGPNGEKHRADDAPEIDVTAEIDSSASLERRAERLSRAQQYGVLGGLTLAAVVVFLVGLVLGGDDEPPPPKPDIPLDAWAPYWTLGSSLDDVATRVPSMREVSPFWFNAVGADSIGLDANADTEAAEEFVERARQIDVELVPSIVDALPAGEMAAILADPDARELHVRTLARFADDGGYDGIDINYEQFAFADGSDTWADTRPNWVAFIRQLSDALAADGRSLTVSIPPVYDDGRTGSSGFWVYDHGAIAPYVDRIRVMAYDFSVAEPGPIAPLDFVERSIEGVLAATGDPDKVVLGIPSYGRNWPVAVTGECPADVEIPGTTSINNRTLDDLLERRDATPAFDPDTGESSFAYDLEVVGAKTTCVQRRQVHYVGPDGVKLRMDLARQYQLDGAALWAFGFDSDAVWEAILPTVET